MTPTRDHLVAVSLIILIIGWHTKISLSLHLHHKPEVIDKSRACKDLDHWQQVSIAWY